MHPSRVQRLVFHGSSATLAFMCALMVGACGAVTCPEPLSDVDGTCQELGPVVTDQPDASVEPDARLEPDASVAPEPPIERCDGADNDGDTEVDEDWPELGEPCGEGVGECVEGAYMCSEDGTGVVCEGAVGPSDEVCDGKDNDCDGTPDNGPKETCDNKDNDCDGLIDEGALSVKQESFADHASVAAVDGGFLVTRIVSDRLRVETYDTQANRTGLYDDMGSPAETKFLGSDSSGQRVLAALGQYSFHVVEVHVDSDLAPIIIDTQELHADWRQGETLGVYDPPYHPRVLAAPSRFVGYRDLITFALNPFTGGDLAGLAQEPTVAMEIPLYAAFDADGLYVMWEQGDKVRGALLQNDGNLLLETDIARGDTPGIDIRPGGPGVLYVQDGKLRLSELGGLTLLCMDRGFCNETILERNPTGPMALAYDEGSDTWFVVAGTELAVVARGGLGAIVKQAEVLDSLSNSPNRVDVVVSDGTAAIMQAAKHGKSALTFMGCF